MTKPSRKQPLDVKSGGGTAEAAVTRPKAAPKTPQPRKRKTPLAESVPLEAVDHSIEKAVGVTVDELTALYVLDGLKGFGPQKFKELHAHGLTARSDRQGPVGAADRRQARRRPPAPAEALNASKPNRSAIARGNADPRRAQPRRADRHLPRSSLSAERL